MLLINLSGCHSDSTVEPKPIEQDEDVESESEPKKEIYTTGSLIAQKDDWLFYSNLNDGGKLYKFNISKGEHIKVNNDRSWNISIVDNWIYYLSGDKASNNLNTSACEYGEQIY